MPMDAIAPGPFNDGSGLTTVVIAVIVVAAVLGFALWRYFRKRSRR